MNVAAAVGYACPGCRDPMLRRRFARRPEGEVTLDICFPCQSIWFDHYESAQLTPGATIELFRMIHEHGSEASRPLSANARCPVCAKKLMFTHDVQGTNRFTYDRCPDWHGRFITFFHFLREKHFVRSLSGPEIERLRATVKQVRCSSCGAPVNVEKDGACSHCRAPLSILDADAVERTLGELGAKERGRRAAPSPTAEIDALLEGQRVQRRLDRLDRDPGHVDLLREALGALARIL
jgi:hypothetical protein